MLLGIKNDLSPGEEWWALRVCSPHAHMESHAEARAWRPGLGLVVDGPVAWVPWGG